MRYSNFSLGWLTLFLCLFFNGLVAQQRLNGEILDESGEALIGASITIKRTNRGTVTDIEGRYSIICSPGETLVFSYTGYSTTETLITESSFRRGEEKSKLGQKRVEGITSSAYQSAIRQLRDSVQIPERDYKKIRLKKQLNKYREIKKVKVTDDGMDFILQEQPLKLSLIHI